MNKNIDSWTVTVPDYDLLTDLLGGKAPLGWSQWLGSIAGISLRAAKYGSAGGQRANRQPQSTALPGCQWASGEKPVADTCVLKAQALRDETGSVVSEFFCPWISLKSLPFCDKSQDVDLIEFCMCCAFPLFSGYVKRQDRKWFIEFVFLSLYIQF